MERVRAKTILSKGNDLFSSIQNMHNAKKIIVELRELIEYYETGVQAASNDEV